MVLWKSRRLGASLIDCKFGPFPLCTHIAIKNHLFHCAALGHFRYIYRSRNKIHSFDLLIKVLEQFSLSIPVVFFSVSSDTASESDHFVHIDEVHDHLKSLSLEDFSTLAIESSLSISTQATGELQGNPSTIISCSHIEVGADGSYGMYMASG